MKFLRSLSAAFAAVVVLAVMVVAAEAQPPETFPPGAILAADPAAPVAECWSDNVPTVSGGLYGISGANQAAAVALAGRPDLAAPVTTLTINEQRQLFEIVRLELGVNAVVCGGFYGGCARHTTGDTFVCYQAPPPDPLGPGEPWKPVLWLGEVWACPLDFEFDRVTFYNQTVAGVFQSLCRPTGAVPPVPQPASTPTPTPTAVPVVRVPASVPAFTG